jgi:glucans biosynthesis protein C
MAVALTPISPPSLPSPRRPELDGLRVTAIVILHFFHTGMMFNTWGWHLKNPEPLPALEIPMEILHYVRMPLLMVIAGAATAFAFARRGPGAFFLDRAKRLLLPVLFGMLVIVPPQIYVERVAQGAFHGSYLDFYPQVFQFRPYPEGAFSWHHLWFVVYLFVYSALLAVVVALARRVWRTCAAALPQRSLPPALVCAAFLPLAAIQLWLREYPETHALIDDPRTLLYYGALFLYGHLLGRSPRVWTWLRDARRPLAGALAVLCAVMLPPNEWPDPLEHLGAFAFVWLTILNALAWGPSWFPRRTPLLAHAQELAYPFYLFHQTVIIVVGWAVLTGPLGPTSAWPRFGFVLVVSFAVTSALCLLCARVGVLRPLLGMAPRRDRAAPRV